MTLFDDPAKQKRYEDALESCKDFDPPLTNDELSRIRTAVYDGDTVMLRCTFYTEIQFDIPTWGQPRP